MYPVLWDDVIKHNLIQSNISSPFVTATFMLYTLYYIIIGGFSFSFLSKTFDKNILLYISLCCSASMIVYVIIKY